MGTVTRCPCGHRNRCCETVRTRRRMRCRRTFGGWHRRIDWGWGDQGGWIINGSRFHTIRGNAYSGKIQRNRREKAETNHSDTQACIPKPFLPIPEFSIQSPPPSNQQCPPPPSPTTPTASSPPFTISPQPSSPPTTPSTGPIPPCSPNQSPPTIFLHAMSANTCVEKAHSLDYTH